MTKIEIKNLSILFGPEKMRAKRMLVAGKSKQDILKETGCTVAVRNANLKIEEGELFVIMGLSGSGKSTLLRCINRLNEPSLGEVFINGKNITTSSDKELLDIRRKEMAMVFQHFGLLPHRTVLSNIAFGLELQGVPKKERDQKAVESVALVGLKGYENQKVSELSGGMQQRVGLARAIANDPEVLLMDEAFSALDPLIRVQMQDELLKLQEKMQKTIIFITHDLDEAIKLGLIFVRLPPGMPSITISGPNPAAREEMPRIWILAWLLGSAAAVLVTDTPATFPCIIMEGSRLLIWRKSLLEICDTAEVSSFLSSVPYPITTTSFRACTSSSIRILIVLRPSTFTSCVL